MHDREQELVQYIVINGDLGMSAGKAVAQACHGAVLVALREVFRHGLELHPGASADGFLRFVVPGGGEPVFARWMHESFVKITLRGTEEDLLRLEAAGFQAVRDAGRTEVASGSLTAVVLPPMTRVEARPYVGGLRLL